MIPKAPYYGGRKTIWVKTELWKAVAVLISERSNKKTSVKEVREAFYKWRDSGYDATMSFAEFVMKLYS